MGMTPESTATSKETLAAIERHDISSDLIQGLVDPTPHGKDGDQEGDADFEEKLVRLFYTLITEAGGKLQDGERRALGDWISDRRKKGANWDLGASELDKLQNALSSS